MNTLEYPKNSSSFSRGNSLTAVHFYCEAPEAKAVELAGDFNEWRGELMQRRDDGWWYLSEPLAHGHHKYRFVVDGKPTLDPKSMGVGYDEVNKSYSLVAVS